MNNTSIIPTDPSNAPAPSATRREHMLATIEAAEEAAKINDALAFQERAIRAEESVLLEEMAIGLSKQFDSLDLPVLPIRLRREYHGMRGWFRKREATWTREALDEMRLLCGMARNGHFAVAVGVTRDGLLVAVYGHSYWRGWNCQRGDGGDASLIVAPRMNANISTGGLAAYGGSIDESNAFAVPYSQVDPEIFGIDTNHVIDAARTALARHMDALGQKKANLEERKRGLSAS